MNALRQSERYLVSLRLAYHFEKVLRAARDDYQTGGKALHQGLQLFDRKIRNIEKSQQWCEGRALEDEAIAGLCVRYCEAGDDILPLRLGPQENIRWIESALAAQRRLGDESGRCRCLARLGAVYILVGDLQGARLVLEENKELADALGDQRAQASALFELGNLHAELRKYELAKQLMELALALYQELGDESNEAAVLDNLGIVESAGDKHESAMEFHKRSLGIKRRLGERLGEAKSLANLASAHVKLENLDSALGLHLQSLAIEQELAHRFGEAQSLAGLGQLYLLMGQHQRSVAALELSLEIQHELGITVLENVSQQILAEAQTALSLTTSRR